MLSRFRVLALLALGTMLSAPESAAQEAPSENQLGACLTADELQIDGFEIAARTHTLEAFGTPDSTYASFTVDDGGMATISSYVYGETTVHVVRDFIDGVWTESSRVVGPRGIAVGMTREDAATLFGAALYLSDSPDRGAVDGCGDGAIFLHFGADDRIQKLEAILPRP